MNLHSNSSYHSKQEVWAFYFAFKETDYCLFFFLLVLANSSSEFSFKV